MANEIFFEKIFPGDFWESLDRSRLINDDNSMFGDQHVFDWIIATVRPREIIEIGSWKGHSANYMIDKAKELGIDSRILCIDTYSGGPEHWVSMLEALHRDRLGRPTILERFLGNTLTRGNAGRVFPFTVDSKTGKHILRQFDFKADLIYIDGGHDPDIVRNDVMGYYPFLSETGVMFGDDYQYCPLAETVHACARDLGLPVMVSSRKWVLANDALMRRFGPPDSQIRSSFDGWVHP